MLCVEEEELGVSKLLVEERSSSKLHSPLAVHGAQSDAAAERDSQLYGGEQHQSSAEER